MGRPVYPSMYYIHFSTQPSNKRLTHNGEEGREGVIRAISPFDLGQ